MQKGGGAMKHIAVVEDEALMREELADMLRRASGPKRSSSAVIAMESRSTFHQREFSS